MSYRPRQRWKPRRPRGLKTCVVCGRKVPHLLQHDRWVFGVTVIVCREDSTLSMEQIQERMQQKLELDSPAPDSQEGKNAQT